MCNAWALYRRFWRLSGKLTDDVRVRGARLAFGSHPSITKWCCRCCKMKGSMVVEHQISTRVSICAHQRMSNVHSLGDSSSSWRDRCIMLRQNGYQLATVWMMMITLYKHSTHDAGGGFVCLRGRCQLFFLGGRKEQRQDQKFCVHVSEISAVMANANFNANDYCTHALTCCKLCSTRVNCTPTYQVASIHGCRIFEYVPPRYLIWSDFYFFNFETLLLMKNRRRVWISRCSFVTFF